MNHSMPEMQERNLSLGIPRRPPLAHALLVAGLLLCLGTSMGIAETYYVDTTAGSDSFAGTTPIRSQSNGPWKSLANLSITKFKPGDAIKLRCGQIWREKLVISTSGSPEHPITITAYGECAQNNKPSIRPTIDMVDWVSTQTNVVTATLNVEPTRLWHNGRLLAPVRYPAVGWMSVRQTATGLFLSPSIATEDVTADLTESSAFIKTAGWKLESRRVVSQKKEEIALDRPTEIQIIRPAGIFFEGKSWMLATSQGWYWDKKSRLLHISSKNKIDKAQRIEASFPGHALTISNANHLVIRGLRFGGAGDHSVLISGGSNISLIDLEIFNSGLDGIHATNNPTGLRIESCTIRESLRDGIALNKADGAIVVGNLIQRSGVSGPPRKSHGAIEASKSKYVRIENNHIDESGYIGIAFSGHSQVRNNIIRNSCMTLDDCGAIYTWQSHEAVYPLMSEISGNYIQGIHGNHAGNPDTYTVAAGIYLDDLSNNAQVLNNVVIDAERSMYIHNGFANAVFNNTFLNHRKFGVVISMDHDKYPTDRIGKNVLRGNVVVSKSGDVTPVFYLDKFGRGFTDEFNQNKYVNHSSNFPFVVQGPKVSGSIQKKRTLEMANKELGQEKGGASITPTALHVLSNDGRTDILVECPFADATACHRGWQFIDNSKVDWPVLVPALSALPIIRP